MTLSLLQFLNETKPEPMIWDYISPSRLNLWMKCPLAFRLRYIDGIESPTSPSLFVGKVTHDVLDGIYRCAMVQAYATEHDVPRLVDDAWSRAMESELVKTKAPKIVTHKFPPRSGEHFKRFFNIVREYIDALDRGVFNYRPSWNCGMCEHSGLCV